MTQLLLVVVLVLALVVAALWVVLIRMRADLQQLVEIHQVDEAEEDIAPATQPTPDPVKVPRQRAADSVAVAERVPVITQLNGAASAGASDLTAARVASVTLGRPLVKAASFAYGVRRALDDEHRIRMQVAFRSELRRQRKLRRRAVHATSTEGSDS
jgi:hypothetical protein